MVFGYCCLAKVFFLDRSCRVNLKNIYFLNISNCSVLLFLINALISNAPCLNIIDLIWWINIYFVCFDWRYQVYYNRYIVLNVLLSASLNINTVNYFIVNIKLVIFCLFFKIPTSCQTQSPTDNRTERGNTSLLVSFVSECWV